MGMTTSTASDLILWTHNREDDIEQARLMVKYVRLHTKPADRIRALRILHTTIECVRISVRQLNCEIARLSMCPCDRPPADCVCEPPF